MVVSQRARAISRRYRMAGAAALASVVICIGCVTDRVENVRLYPRSGGAESPPVVTDGDVRRLLEIIDDVAAEFEFRRELLTPEAQRVKDDVARPIGFIIVAEYTRRVPRAYVLMNVSRATDAPDLVVSASTLRGGSAADFLAQLRHIVEARLHDAFPEWRIEVESGTVDATLAP